MAHPKEFAEGLSIGIIMDGNGRWAKNRGLPRTAGHKRGAEVFSDIADYCDELGVASVYFYAFSTENWKRPLEEVNAIMRLFGEYLLKGFDYKNRNIRIKFLGDRTVLDPKLQELMNKLEAESSVKTGMTLNIAINYGGRPEIVRAAQQLAEKAAAPTSCCGRQPTRNWWKWTFCGRISPAAIWTPPLRNSIIAPAGLADCNHPFTPAHGAGTGMPDCSSGCGTPIEGRPSGRTKENKTYENSYYYCNRGHHRPDRRDVHL